MKRKGDLVQFFRGVGCCIASLSTITVKLELFFYQKNSFTKQKLHLSMIGTEGNQQLIHWKNCHHHHNFLTPQGSLNPFHLCCVHTPCTNGSIHVFFLQQSMNYCYSKELLLVRGLIDADLIVGFELSRRNYLYYIYAGSATSIMAESVENKRRNSQ